MAGPKNAARSVADSLKPFSLLMPDSLIETIVQFTNNRISTFHEQFPEHAQVVATRLIILDELKAYFGFLYLHTARLVFDLEP